MTDLPMFGVVLAVGLAVGSFLNVCIHRLSSPHLPRGLEGAVADGAQLAALLQQEEGPQEARDLPVC